MKQTVVITGASRGIGRAVALAFAEKSASKNNHEEYNIFVNCAKNSELLENVKKQIRDLGVCCESFTGDISNYNTAMEMFDEVHRHFGNVDILVNNAGISIIGLFQDMTRDEWDRIMNVNVGSVYNCCHFAIPDMIKDMPLIMYNTDSVQNETLDAIFKNSAIKPNVILHASQLYTIKSFICEECAGAFLYSSLLKKLPGVVGIPITPTIHQSIGLVWKKGNYTTDSTDKFISFVKKHTIL